MTLRQLANHTSGIYSYTDNAPDGSPGIMEGNLTDPVAMSKGFEPDELIAFAARHGTPNFQPGEAGNWSYSNTGYVLLGQIIEKITGKPLGKAFEDRIFTPLEMHDSYLWNGVPRAAFGLPSSYFAAPFDIESTYWNMSQGWSAGAVISTVDDMTTFITALLEGKLFADPATLDLMQQTVPTKKSAVMPGYGIGLIEKQPGLWGHGGQTLGYVSDIAYFSDADISVVVWTTSAQNRGVIAALSVSGALSSAGMITP